LRLLRLLLGLRWRLHWHEHLWGLTVVTKQIFGCQRRLWLRLWWHLHDGRWWWLIGGWETAGGGIPGGLKKFAAVGGGGAS